jgi:hypothetical protein
MTLRHAEVLMPVLAEAGFVERLSGLILRRVRAMEAPTDMKVPCTKLGM